MPTRIAASSGSTANAHGRCNLLIALQLQVAQLLKLFNDQRAMPLRVVQLLSALRLQAAQLPTCLAAAFCSTANALRRCKLFYGELTLPMQVVQRPTRIVEASVSTGNAHRCSSESTANALCCRMLINCVRALPLQCSTAIAHCRCKPFMC